MKLRRFTGIVSLIGSLLTAGILNAAGISKRIYPAHDSTSSVGAKVAWWVNDGASDTLYSNIDVLYNAWEDTHNFLWQPAAGDTIKSKDSLQVGSNIYTGHMRAIYRGGNLTLPPGFIDDPNKPVKAYTFGIWKVRDPQNIGTIKGEGWLNKNPNQKIPFWNYVRNADTLDLTDPYGQNYFNTECQDSLWKQDDLVTIRLYSQKGDTIWESDTTFALDTLKHGSATVLDSLIFPERMIINDLTPPTISNLTQLVDQDSVGKWLISANINDASGIYQAWLLRKVNGIADSALADSNQASSYFFTFPEVALHYPFSQLEYAVKAIDNSSNHNQTISTWQSFKAYPKDLSLEELLLPGIADSGSIIVPKTVSKNYGIEQHQGKFKVQIGSFYKDSLEAILSGQTTDTLTFKPCTLNVLPQSYDAIAKVKLDGDVNPSNDSLIRQLQVKLPYKDIALLEILSPPDTVNADSSYPVSLRIKNLGSIADSAKIACEIRRISPDSLVYSDSSKLYVPADSARELQFIDWNTPQNGELYAIKFKNLVADSNSSNDSLLKQIYVKTFVGAKEFKKQDKSIIKMWPVPAQANSSLNLWLPKGAKASVYDLTGRYVTNLKNENGTTLWNFKDSEGNKVSSGIYFIRIESPNDKSKVEKAVLLK